MEESKNKDRIGSVLPGEGKEFKRLVAIMAVLRGPGGCPWDREQDHETLKPYLVEESYEVLDAIDSGDPAKLKEELGDLLLQVVFHSQLAHEKGTFSIEDVVGTINEKLVRRHPHVFGDVKAETSKEVLKNWEAIKKEENNADAGEAGVLQGVPRTLPALLKAYRLQQKAAGVGFDWEERSQVKAKVLEEWRELEEAVECGEGAHVKEEFGDLLFALVNLGRFLDLDAESALQAANDKFIMRFKAVEEGALEIGKSLHEMSLSEMDILWEDAKGKEKMKKQAT